MVHLFYTYSFIHNFVSNSVREWKCFTIASVLTSKYQQVFNSSALRAA